MTTLLVLTAALLLVLFVAPGAGGETAPAHEHMLNGLCPACPPWTTTVDYARLERELFALADGTPVQTPADWARKREEIRERVLATLGPFPEQAPLQAQVLQEDQYQGLTRRKVSYQVEAGERLSAWLLLPAGLDLTKQHPALLCAHQTVNCGKDEPIGACGAPHLNYALVLTQKYGYITLVPDYLAAGERVLPDMKPFFTDDFYQRHPEWSMFGKNLWDSQRAIDYLQSLPFVDPEKIGMVGHSLGGCNTTLTAAFDERVKVATDSCSGLQPFQANWKWALEYSRDHWYIYCPALGPFFLKETVPWDIHELMSLIAPRPYLQTGAFNDGCNPNPLDRVRCAGLVRKVYALLGAGDKFNLFMHHGTHGYPSIAVDMGAGLFDRVFGVERGAPGG